MAENNTKNKYAGFRKIVVRTVPIEQPSQYQAFQQNAVVSEYENEEVIDTFFVPTAPPGTDYQGKPRLPTITFVVGEKKDDIFDTLRKEAQDAVNERYRLADEVRGLKQKNDELQEEIEKLKARGNSLNNLASSHAEQNIKLEQALADLRKMRSFAKPYRRVR